MRGYKCEGLTTDLCSTAYPQCKVLNLESCCKGSIGVCINDFVELNAEVCEKTLESNLTLYCLRNLISNAVYQLTTSNISIYKFENYEIYLPPTNTCESLNCDAKGLECQMSIEPCDSDSPCCKSVPRCVDRKTLDHSIKTNVICNKQCDEGFVCKIVVDVPTCFALSCDSITCTKGTQCQELQGLGVVSCFSSFIEFLTENDDDSDFDPELGCEDVKCPPNFQCKKGAFSNHDCIPSDIDTIGTRFNCSRCPVGWRCDPFGWGGICMEWFPDLTMEDCFYEKCLKNQICNKESKKCEYQLCLENTCSEGLTCVQYQPTHPRICATENILPFSFAVDNLVPLPPGDKKLETSVTDDPLLRLGDENKFITPKPKLNN
ncbi:hypothetical protein DLAC_10724 [Tieghemostelium lacteum]|uniref:DSCP-N domain-containing protein n=1 Tax=Tieghemostelium lacteum TaxID=361077 RepID=A0A151Z408_TIELA|nr:hypothetical protein DLAC_10724 [Tieghemostelium lacteum]|eukprot:KYQ88703.1 hypothetical protein DLAC_10724 [Tieghemostelium lacteum]